jgi:hypothetical protein
MAKNNTMMIVAIAAAGCFFLIIIAVVVYFAFFNKKKENTATSSSTTTANRSPSPSPSPSPSSNVTISSENFDPTGFTVGSGWLFNRKTIGGPSDGSWCDTSSCYTTTKDANECRQKCVNNTSCVHFARSETTDGKCFLFEEYTNPSWGVEAKNNAHVRGFKKDGDNNYTKPGFFSNYYDSASWADKTKKEEFTLQACVNKCKNDSNCQAFAYRTNAWSNGETPNPGNKTCILYGHNTSATDKFREGGVGR